MVRKKEKRNPVDNTYINLLICAYNEGDPYELTYALIYKNQGKKCEDCENDFDDCNCDYCDNCEFSKCLCDLKLNLWASSDHITKIIRDKVLKLAKQDLNKNQLDYFNSKRKKR